MPAQRDGKTNPALCGRQIAQGSATGTDQWAATAAIVAQKSRQIPKIGLREEWHDESVSAFLGVLKHSNQPGVCEKLEVEFVTDPLGL